MMGMIDIKMNDRRSSMVLDTLCTDKSDQLNVNNKSMN